MDNRARTLPAHRGFTLIELMIAAVITAFLLGSVALSVGQLGRARNTVKLRFDAHIRADAALSAIRRDVAGITRAQDLFYTRLLLLDDVVRGGSEEFDRDELLVFNTRLRAMRDIDFNGEGFEYETQFRIIDDDQGPALWQRADAFPDQYTLAGGKATPLVEGILGLTIQVYDGFNWYDEWDSDISGLPKAVSVIVLASGHRGPDDVFAAPRAFLRTIIPIDRVIPPKTAEEEEEEAEDEAGGGADIDGDGIPDVDMDGDGQPDPSSALGGNDGGGGGGGQRPPPGNGPGGGDRPGGQDGGGGRPGGGPPPPPAGGPGGGGGRGT